MMLEYTIVFMGATAAALIVLHCWRYWRWVKAMRAWRAEVKRAEDEVNRLAQP